MEWLVKKPPLYTEAMGAALERRGVERVTGFSKRGEDGYMFNVSGGDSHPGREIVIGPRGGIRSDTQVDYEYKREQREKRKARQQRKAEGGFKPVYGKDGSLIGIRLW